MTAALELRSIHAAFGGLTALDEVSLDVPAGQVLGLIGPNGAGKSTLFNVISGLVRPRLGAVRMFGRDITRLGPHRRARLGLARTFQQLEIIGMLSVRENVLVAAEIRRGWSADRTPLGPWVEKVLERVGVAALADRRADSLATGPARLVEIARALAIDPRILLLDEPASGLDAREASQLVSLLRSLAGDGLAVVLVDHNMHVVMGACERVAVLDRGKLVMVGEPAKVRADERVRRAYLGLSGAPG